MPWKVKDAMSERLDLVTLAAQPGANMAELCRRFGVSRKTGYKWLKRFAEVGSDGLVDRSRRPKVSPRRTVEAVEAAAVELRRANPVWGGRKIRRVLQRDAEAGSAVPAASTITGILRRGGLLERETPAPVPLERFEAEAHNLLWQMDFKGHFALDGRTDGKGERCFPLTVLDDHSRYLLGAQACRDECETTVRERLTRVRAASTVSSGGRRRAQASAAWSQRGLKRQPSGSSPGCGTTPGMDASRSVSPSGTLARRAAV